MFYPNDEGDERLMAGDPVFRRIHFENISISCGSWCQYTGSFLGMPRSPIRDLRLVNVKVVQGNTHGWLCGSATNVTASGLAPSGLPVDCPSAKPLSGTQYGIVYSYHDRHNQKPLV